jgi:uncharacterized protein
MGFYKKILILFVVVGATFCFSSALILPQEPKGNVFDSADLLSPEAIKNIEEDLVFYSKTSKTDLRVVVVEDIGNIPVSLYAQSLIKKWEIGTSTGGNGVVLLIAKNNRQARIEVVGAIKNSLTDVVASQILEEYLIASFSKGKVDDGVIQTVRAIEGVVLERKEVASTKTGSIEVRTGDILGSLLTKTSLLTFLFCLLVMAIVRARNKKGHRFLGVIVGVALGILFSFVGAFGSVVGGVFIATPVLAVVMFFFDKSSARVFAFYSNK